MPTLHVRRKLGVWQTNSPSAHFQQVHKKIQEARDRGRKEQEKDEALRAERLEKEAESHGFDRV